MMTDQVAKQAGPNERHPTSAFSRLKRLMRAISQGVLT